MTESTDADIIKEIDGQMSLFTDAELKKMERGEEHGYDCIRRKPCNRSHFVR